MNETSKHRAETWDDFIGQTILKERLQIHIQSSLKRVKPLDHVLLAGPPGMGKTTVARLIGIDLDDDVKSAIMPISTAFLRSVVMQHQGILFLDEIHRGSKKQQEELLPLLEDGYLHLPSGQKLHNAWLTIIGATTCPEDIIPPLYDRFTIKPLFEPYSETEMAKMILVMCKQESISLPPELSVELAKAANGVPRNARQLVLAARSILSVSEEVPTVDAITSLCGLTANGLNEYHLLYLKSLHDLGGKSGLSTLCTILRLHPKVVQELERVLVSKQMIQYSPSGREMLSNGYLTYKTITNQKGSK